MSQIKTAVSLYSLQDQYARKKMSLDDIFKFVTDMNAGIEFISDQMLHGTPHPSDEVLKQWDALVEKYHPELVCNDIFINSCLYENRTLTHKEQVNMLIDEIKLSHRLGFPMVRLVSKTDPSLIEPALPYAEKYNVIITQEIHAGMSFDNPYTKGYVDVMKKLNSPYVGLTVDTGIFCNKIARVFVDYFRYLGVGEYMIDFFDKIYEKGMCTRQYYLKNCKEGQLLPDDVARLVQSETDRDYALLTDSFETSPFSILDDYMPYVKHIHGKLFEMTEDGEEYCIPYREFIKYLKDNNYDGYISTEYEGNRFTLPGNPVRDKENVMAHQKMLKKYIEE